MQHLLKIVASEASTYLRLKALNAADGLLHFSPANHVAFFENNGCEAFVVLLEDGETDIKVCAAWTISHLILGSGAQFAEQMAEPRLIEALKHAMSSANESLAMQGA